MYSLEPSTSSAAATVQLWTIHLGIDNTQFFCRKRSMDFPVGPQAA